MKTQKQIFGAMLSMALFFSACGGSDEGGNSVSPSTSPSASTANSSKAVSSASDIVLSSALMGTGSGPKQGTTKNLAKALAKAVESFDVSVTTSVLCHSGSGSENTRATGSATVDDVADVVTALAADITLEGTLDNCTEADDPQTADFDESKLVVSGSYKGAGHVQLQEDKLTFPLKVEGSVTVGGEACPAGGSLSFNLSCDATAQVPLANEDADFSGIAGGSLSGNVCGVQVDCTVSGDCEEPKVSGTGCE